MSKINEMLAPFGIQTAKIMIPNKKIDYKKWAVIACDQYSSEPEYWDRVKKEVEDSPSTLNLVFPECYLDKGNDDSIIASINTKMNEYLQNNIFQTTEECFILVKRTLRSGAQRWGLMATVDLDCYDFSKDSKSLIRATEGTIIDRIPPRLKIRKDASVELPHIMVLVDDSKAPLIEPLKKASQKIAPLYYTELLENSGKLTAYKIDDEKLLKIFAKSLKKLANIKKFTKKHSTSDLLLFAIGDGNHSLATAKTQWEEIKKSTCPCDLTDHPARFALIELNSIYDKGIEFEPIHRVLFKATGEKFLQDFAVKFQVEISEVQKDSEMEDLAQSIPPTQQFILITEEGKKRIKIINPDKNLTVGTLQVFLDQWLIDNKECEIDYIHGVESTNKLGSASGNFGIILPNIRKREFFGTVISDGSFPRKTFSMGESHEKRFYFELRKIR